MLTIFNGAHITALEFNPTKRFFKFLFEPTNVQIYASTNPFALFLSFHSLGSCFLCDANFQLVACHCDKSLYSSHHKQYNLSLTLISTLKMAGCDLDENGKKHTIKHNKFHKMHLISFNQQHLSVVMLYHDLFGFYIE